MNVENTAQIAGNGSECKPNSTPWHDLPPHIKITYQSQAQYERAIDARKGHKVT